MALLRKPQPKDAAFRRLVSLVFIIFIGFVILILLLRTHSVPMALSPDETDEVPELKTSYNYSQIREVLNLPKQSELSIQLERKNQFPPRNLDLYPRLARNHITIVLYVHNRPQYLQIAVKSLSRVVGISETLLIVSHDGYFEEMNKIVEDIKFSQVKQIFAPYSPHLFVDSFPGTSPTDCQGKDDVSKHCAGNPDQYGNHRSPNIVSLKHHWWWMMNTVWDGLKETQGQSGYILFIEEDHFIFPNAYRNIQMLTALKSQKCPDCYAANLAPCDVNARGERSESLFAERMGNIGYAFNRTVWNIIHKKAREFCFFDDYNWDITMWTTVYPSFGGPVYTLRGPRTSAVHFGKCGLHQGQGERGACIDNGSVNIDVEEIDKISNIKSEWGLTVFEHQPGYKSGFRGWGGWGDERDHNLCLNFAKMYRSVDTN